MMSATTNNDAEEATKKEPIFRDINADDQNTELTEIESACMNCFQSGQSRILLTKIPFFKEVVIMSFKCEECGFENNEIQSASEIQVKGVRIVLDVKSPKDMNRRVVRSDYTAVSIPELELEIPSQSQKGEITTVEGILDRTIRGLTQDQEKRRLDHPEAAASIEDFISKCNAIKNLEKPFTVVLEDISGNSFVENPAAPTADHNCKTTHFKRSKAQDNTLGLFEREDIPKDATGDNSKENHLLKPIPEGSWTLDELHGEVLQFHTLCSNCRSPCETNMKLTNIPHFKDVVIMATVCDVCGCKTNEVKSGGGIEEKGTRFEVHVESKEDLTRDVLKSETCSLSIPELDFEVGPAALGGRFTTVEGIFTAIKEQLAGNDVMFRDSSNDAENDRMEDFLQQFDEIVALKKVVSLVLDDPAGNSYVQSLRDDDEADDKLKIEKYDRTFEQKEELGLNDIKTENYGEK